jgi:hypothetical protein
MWLTQFRMTRVGKYPGGDWLNADQSMARHYRSSVFVSVQIAFWRSIARPRTELAGAETITVTHGRWRSTRR